jgi:general secretion pathway protein D
MRVQRGAQERPPGRRAAGLRSGGRGIYQNSSARPRQRQRPNRTATSEASGRAGSLCARASTGRIGEIAQELRATQNLLRAKVAVNRDGKTELEALVERMRDQPTPGLEMPTASPLPDSLTFRSAASQDVLTALARMANVNVIFDPAFRSTPISIDLRGQTFDQALSSITASTQNFFRVTAPGTVTVIPDTPAKRREYEEEIVRTFYLSNADLKETMDLLRIVIDARRIGSVAGTNAITIHDTEDRISAAGRLISMIDKARPEVLIDVELLEVNRTKLNQYGLQLASPGSPGINGVADANRANLSLDGRAGQSTASHAGGVCRTGEIR